MNPKFKRGRRFIFFPLIALFFVSVASYIVMILWNAILPEVITSVKTITYYQAVGLLILSRILFGTFRGGGSYRGKHVNTVSPWREKMMNMSDEEREKFRKEWKARCENK